MANRSKNFPDIRGFEYYPLGKLLAQRLDFDGPVGFAYERCIGYSKPKHSHDRITITFPRGSSRSFIKVFLPEIKRFSLSESVVHVMAKDQVHEQGSVSSVYDTFALFVTPDYFRNHLEKAGAVSSEVRTFLETTQSIDRSAILEQSINRYFFCSVLETSPPKTEVGHLESVILTELFSLGRRKGGKKVGPVSSGLEQAPDETAFLRAIEHIEANLFEPLDVATLVGAARTSQATLFRLFQREIRVSPLEYVRKRRLDEARSLLKTGSYQVGDVALLVGYDELSAFSKAFKLRFKKAPSEFLPEAKRTRTGR